MTRTLLWLNMLVWPFTFDLVRHALGFQPASQFEYELHFAALVGTSIFLSAHWFLCAIDVIPKVINQHAR